MTEGVRDALRPARGMWKQVSLKSYAPNTIRAFDCCHVSAEEARVVLKSPWVKPAAAWDARTEQDTGACCQVMPYGQGDPHEGTFGLRWYPRAARPAQGHKFAKA